MFCEVEITGRTLLGKIIIPRSALHDDQVYILDTEKRLRRKQVTISFAQADFVVIRDGLDAGEKVVVSDVVPAADGLLLAPQEDDELSKRIAAQAGGLKDVY